ncbi:Uncharacterised protein [Achromobacter xylosoxidans]|nr:Uncharacterised protein [Achromobacter xylosoxidans]
MLQPPRVEHHGIVGVGQLGRIQVRPRVEPRAAVGGGERQARAGAVVRQERWLADAVVEIADRVAVRPVGARAGPLQRRLAQPRMAGAAQVVAGGGVGEGGDLVEHLGRAGVLERVAVAHLAGHAGDDAPVGQRVPGRRHGLWHQRQGAFGIDHHALGLGPQRARQQDVGVAVGLGVQVGVLRDHQFRRPQPRHHIGAVGHAGHRVGADDPAGLDLARRHALEQVDGALPEPRMQRAGRHAPARLDKGAVGGRQHAALARQAGTHVAHLAPAHGVGLAGQRERAAAGPADAAGGQVQVAQRVGVPGAVGALVQPHGPAAHPFGRRADPVDGLAQLRGGDAGQRLDPLGRVVAQEVRHRLPAVGVGGDEGRVGLAGLVQQVQQAVEQRQVGARPDRQVQVRLLGGGGAARVDHDQARAGLDPFHHAQVQDRMAIGHVGPDHQEQVGAVDVLVRAGRSVGAQRLLVAAGGAGHAQPRIRFNVVGADEALGQFVGQVLGLDRHLP